MDVYAKTDKLIAEAKLEAARQFNTVRRKASGLADFDELNVLVKRLYSRLEARNRKLFNEIMAQEYKDCLEGEASDDELEDLLLLVFDDELDEILDGYDPVTGYVYNREAERKRERLFEKTVSILSNKPDKVEGENGEMLTIPVSNDMRQAFDSAFRLWSKMTEEYGIRAHDRARIDAFLALNGKRVIWRTEKDGKVCSGCRALEGQIFPIENVPDKLHPNCRCWQELV